VNWQLAEVGSEAFNLELSEVLEAVGQAVKNELGSNLVALVLGGGYGRGEGGVYLHGGQERPYNDLDFTLLVSSKGLVDEQRLKAAVHSLEQRVGIDIDFSRPVTVGDVQRWPHWLMWHDLLLGHLVIVGSADILCANVPKNLWQAPPLIEASRLLLNRGAGLLWSQLVHSGCQAAPDRDFVRRNLHKTWLALGDAFLLMEGRYSTAYRDRAACYQDVIAKQPGYAALVPLPRYLEALRFRLAPHEFQDPIAQTELDQARTAWGEVFLKLETRRIGVPFADGPSYRCWAGLREPEQNRLSQWPRNLFRNLQLGRLSVDYPRERLFREILGLMVKPDPIGTEAFLNVWRRFN
jgi:hypothetical protein